MTEEEIKNLDKEVKKLKRIAGYLEIPGLAQSTYDACKAWAEANAKLAAIQKG